MIFDATIDIIVYRGGTEVFPENSIQAIEQSLKELPNALIELDIALKYYEKIIIAKNFSKNWYTSETENWIKEHQKKK